MATDMGDVLVVTPVRAVARWIADSIRSRGHYPVVARDLREVARVASFVQFSAVIVWLPSKDLDALAAALPRRSPSRPSFVILSWARANQLAPTSWYLKGIDRAIALPTTSSVLLEAMEHACHPQSWTSQTLPQPVLVTRNTIPSIPNTGSEAGPHDLAVA